MTSDQFRRLLDTYGADPARWPPAERTAAEALIDVSADARALWLAAQRLDMLFATDRTPAASPAEKSAISEAALGRIRRLPRRSFDWRFLFSREVEAAFAAAVLAGLFAGFAFGPALDPPSQHSVPALALLLGENDVDGWL